MWMISPSTVIYDHADPPTVPAAITASLSRPTWHSRPIGSPRRLGSVRAGAAVTPCLGRRCCEDEREHPGPRGPYVVVDRAHCACRLSTAFPKGRRSGQQCSAPRFSILERAGGMLAPYRASTGADEAQLYEFVWFGFVSDRKVTGTTSGYRLRVAARMLLLATS